MRPDANSWRYTNSLSTLQFSPRSMLYRRLAGWTVSLLVLQVALSAMSWVAIRACVPATPPAIGAPAVSPGLAGAWERVSSARAINDLSNFAFSQLIALAIIHVVAIPIIRRRLATHIHGMKALFDAIKDLAGGVLPRPLPAGQPGELGYLSLAFNDMASRLLAGRKALMEANQNLEQRVAERTRELSEAAAKLDRMASTDALTGLANRRCYTEQSAAKFARSVLRDTDLVCLLVDLDNFKTVNDHLGHKTGDELLCVASEVLTAACRADDLVARLGGDEFIVVMEMADVSLAQRIADRILTEFARRSEGLLNGKVLPAMPSISIGISSRKTCNAETFEQIVACGDQALYSAKGHGKSRAEVFSGERRVA